MSPQRKTKKSTGAKNIGQKDEGHRESAVRRKKTPTKKKSVSKKRAGGTRKKTTAKRYTPAKPADVKSGFLAGDTGAHSYVGASQPTDTETAPLALEAVHDDVSTGNDQGARDGCGGVSLAAIEQAAANWRLQSSAENRTLTGLDLTEVYGRKPTITTERPGSGFGKADIHGPDDRHAVSDTSAYPYRAVCMLLMSNGGRQSLGTGWLAAPNLIITAGHNLVRNHILQGNAQSVDVFAGRDGDRYTSSWSERVTDRNRILVSSAWLRSGDPNLDYGAILLANGIGQRTGWFRLEPWTASALREMQLYVIGYPSGHHYIQAYASGKIIPNGVRVKTIQYTIDTTGGQSGSPVIFVPPGSTASDPVYCVGIHNQAYTAYNSATRVTPGVIEDVTAWYELSRRG